LFFEFFSDGPGPDRSRADAAKKYVNTKMQTADLISIASLSTNMRLDLDFTDNKAKFSAVLSAYNFGLRPGILITVATGSSEGAAETSGAFHRR